MNHAASQPINITRITKKFSYSRGKLFGFLIVGALLAFELFNYSTTDFALNDLLGGLRFVGVRWATILAIAFCGIDFAGIARLFTPEQGENGPKEVWYLFSAWLLAASMNAMLTWWGVALALVNHQSLGASVIAHDTLIQVVPIFVAIMVWLIRVLIIGTFSMAGNRLFSQADTVYHSKPVPVMHRTENVSRPAQSQPINIRPAPKSSSVSNHSINLPDPTYHPAGMSGYKPSNHQSRQ
ncbi:MAG: hypothetical protein WAV05_11285 [Anaerolineales bacterium]